VSFGGVEALLVPWLASTLGQRVVTETPSDLATISPVHRITGAGGTANPDLPRLIVPRVGISSFALGYLAASEAAEAVKTAMFSLRGKTVDGAGITFVELVSGPVWVPYVDTDVRQFAATYQLHIMTPA
jgi:hypothetical protein